MSQNTSLNIEITSDVIDADVVQSVQGQLLQAVRARGPITLTIASPDLYSYKEAFRLYEHIKNASDHIRVHGIASGMCGLPSMIILQACTWRSIVPTALLDLQLKHSKNEVRMYVIDILNKRKVQYALRTRLRQGENVQIGNKGAREYKLVDAIVRVRK